MVTAPSEVLQGGTINAGGVVQASPKSVKPEDLPTVANSTVGAFFEAGSLFTTTGTTAISPLAPCAPPTVRVGLATRRGWAAGGTTGICWPGPN